MGRTKTIKTDEADQMILTMLEKILKISRKIRGRCPICNERLYESYPEGYKRVWKCGNCEYGHFVPEYAEKLKKEL